MSAVFAESGTLAAAILEEAERRQLGMSTFVAGGNQADVGPADMLSFWADDEGTAAALLYTRSSVLTTRLVRAARTAALRKPVAVLGRVLLSATGDTMETGRLVEALTRQTGVISVGTLEQLFDLGRILADQPVPAGRGVVVVGNSDGAVALAADACRGSGLRLVDLASGDTAALTRALENPVNLTFRATPQDYSDALSAATAHPEVDMVVVVHTPPRLQQSPEVIEAVVAASAAAPEVTFAATMLGAAQTPRIGGPGHWVPVFSFPEHAARGTREACQLRGMDRDQP